MRKWIDLMEGWINLSEVTRPKQRGDVRKLLSNAGYEHKGSGQFGDVYKKPASPYVLKVFSANDAAYLSFLDLVRRHPNPHFPKLFGKTVRLSDTTLAVRMEELEHGALLDALAACKPILQYMDPLSEDDEERGRDFMEAFPTLKQACDLIMTLVESGHALDISARNVMFRGRTIVFADPVADYVQYD